MTDIFQWQSETSQEFVDRVKRRSQAIKRVGTKKEKPLRVLCSELGKVILVEWVCPACSGKPGFKGCIECKGKGVLTGIEKAIYAERNCKY